MTALKEKLSQIDSKRAASDPLPGGCAPFTTSNWYKLAPLGAKPKAKCMSHQLSLNSQLSTSSPLKQASRPTKRLVTLGTARPSPEFFPWESLSMRGPNIDTAKVNGVVEANETMNCVRGEAAYDLSVAMNYGYSAGSPQMLRYITEHTELIHNPQYEDWENCLTCGTTSAIETSFRIFCDPGDTILVEEHTYTGTTSAAKAQGLNPIGIKMDEKGLIPEALDETLSSWDTSKGRKPHVLYMVPSGQNPTGITQPADRKKAIYEVATKHDIYIFEDDPYYFLQLEASEKEATSAEEFAKQLPPTYLSLDTCGRVLRMDTLSKILAPGLRLGWVTGSSQVIEKFLAYTEVGILCPSGASQAMAYKLLDETWGHEGFLNWLSVLALRYRRRRDLFLEAFDKFVPRSAATWEVPDVGMFVWVRIKDESLGTDLTSLDVTERRKVLRDVEDRIFNTSYGEGVLVSKGSWFIPDMVSLDAVYFRVTFAAAEEEDLVGAVETFGKAVQKELGVSV